MNYLLIGYILYKINCLNYDKRNNEKESLNKSEHPGLYMNTK